VVQQRSGVHVAGGVGQAGDRYEQHADEVAQRVVRGESAEALLDELTGGPRPAAARTGAVQHRQITSLPALTRNITDELDTGERAAGSSAHFLPTNDTDAVALEAIALAFLGGIWDLHGENVMLRGGAPVLIDADVAARPSEFQRPDKQQGLEGNGQGPSRTDRIHGQLDGDGSHASQILQYAIEHPGTVIKMIRAAIGNHVARIVPVFTADWAGTLQIYVSMRGRSKHADAQKEVDRIAAGVADGQKGSKGLHGELGDDRGGAWDAELVAELITQDFERGQLPTFSYQPSTGEAKYHGQTIWVGDNLDDSMKYLRLALEKGGGKKQL
jgi:hypothetical protein